MCGDRWAPKWAPVQVPIFPLCSWTQNHLQIPNCCSRFFWVYVSLVPRALQGQRKRKNLSRVSTEQEKEGTLNKEKLCSENEGKPENQGKTENREEPLDVAKAGVACTVEDKEKLEDKGRTDHKGKMEDEEILKDKERSERETKLKEGNPESQGMPMSEEKQKKEKQKAREN